MRGRIMVAGFAVVLVAGACGNSGSSDKSSDTTVPSAGGGPVTTASPADLKKHVPLTGKGITDDTIRVSVISAKTNNPTGSYAAFSEGIKTYFKYRNETDGGIYGRKLVIPSGADRDDQLGNNAQQATASLSQDNAFATFIATALFTGAPVLARAEQPVFMWNINPEFAGHPTFFGNNGALCFTCAGHGTPWLAKTLGVTKVGILAYSADQSKQCAKGYEESFKKYPTAKVVFKDDTLGFAQAVGPQVGNMKKAGVDYVATCVDLQESFTIAKEMNKQSLNAKQSLPQGYDQDFIRQNAALLEGAIVSPQFLAFEVQPQIPEIQKFIEWAGKANVKVSELSATGWQVADEFYTGLAMAGPEFSQEKVVAALNTVTDYSDNGFIKPLDWTKYHIDPTTHPEARGDTECANYTRVEGGKLVPVYGQPGKPWVCFKEDDPTVDNPTYQSFAPA